jgi:O-antigen/teichoic acid export membrane protein
MGRDSTTGSLQLFIAKMVSTIILAIGTIILSIFIGESEYGLYTISLIPAATFLLFQDWGIGAALTKACVNWRTLDNKGDLRGIIVSGLTFEFITGVSLAIFSVLSANYVASVMFDKPESLLPMVLASVSILSMALLAAVQAILIGFERMGLNGITMICQAISQCVLSPLLVFLGYGVLGAVIGYTVASVASSIIAFTLFYFAIYKKIDVKKIKRRMFENLKPMLSYGVPLAIASILGGILIQFFSFMMASFCDTASIGNYKIAVNFGVLLTFFTVPISTVLFPSFSKLEPKTESKLLKSVFASSVKYASLFIIPATVAMMVLAQPIVRTIYGDKYLLAPQFLTLYVITNLFAVFGSLSVPNLLSAQGETRILMKLNGLTLVLGVPLSFLVIPQFGMIGVIAMTIIAALPVVFLGLFWTQGHYGIRVDNFASAKIFAASIFAALVTLAYLSIFSSADWIRLLIGAVMFLAIYITMIPLIGGINQADVNNLREMFASFGLVSKIIEAPLKLMEKLIQLRKSK